MKLTKEAVNEFREMYQQELGVLLTEDEARAEASNFMKLLKLVIRLNRDGDKDEELHDDIQSTHSK